MSIYSANRCGSMDTSTIAANESYGMNDFGRILYEAQCNDMAIFEAIVMTDLAEMKAMSEGTLLLSEAEKANDEAKVSLISKLRTVVEKWWAKIKGAIRNAIMKISTYITTNNKGFIKTFKAQLKDKAHEVDIEATIFDVDGVKKGFPAVKDIMTAVESNKNADGVNKNEIVNAELGKSIGGTVEDINDYRKKAAEHFGKKETKDINALISYLENASKAVKELRTLEDSTKTKVDELFGILKRAEKDAKATDKDKAHDDVIKNMTATVGAYQTILTVMLKTGVDFVKANVRNSKKALYTIAHKAAPVEVLNNSALFEDADMAAGLADDEAETAFDNDINITPEAKEEAEAAIAAVDAE